MFRAALFLRYMKLYLMGLAFLQTEFDLEFTLQAWNLCRVAFVPTYEHQRYLSTKDYYAFHF